MGFIDKLMGLFGYVKATKEAPKADPKTELAEAAVQVATGQKKPKEAATEAAVDIVTGLLKEKLNKKNKK
jgi:hypothetical protein